MRTCIFPSPSGEGSGWVALSAPASSSKFKRFRKHILNKGPLIAPDDSVVDIDDTFVSKLIDNFKSGVVDTVQVPLADDKNRHSEAPDRNIGLVTDIQVEGDKVYAVVEARRHADDLGEIILGSSPMIYMDYKDTRTGKRVGPTMAHLCATNRPHVLGLGPYEPILAATASESSDILMLSYPEAEMTKEELFGELLLKFGIDVAALQESAGAAIADREAIAEFTNGMREALGSAGVLELTAGDELSVSDLISAVGDLATQTLELTAQLEGIAQEKIEAEVDKAISDAYLMPKSKGVAVKLLLSGDREGYESLLTSEPVLKFSAEVGTGSVPTGEYDLDSELERLSSVEPRYFRSGN